MHLLLCSFCVFDNYSRYVGVGVWSIRARVVHGLRPRHAIVARLINNIIHDWSNHLWRPSPGTCRAVAGRGLTAAIDSAPGLIPA